MSEITIQSEQDRQTLIKMIGSLDLAKPWRFQWGLKRKSRSLSANALQHVWYNAIAEQLQGRGSKTDKDEVKDLMKSNFLGWEVKRFKDFKTGEVKEKEVLRATADLDNGESCHYMDQIQEWAMSVGIILETPEDSEYRKWCIAQTE